MLIPLAADVLIYKPWARSRSEKYSNRLDRDGVVLEGRKEEGRKRTFKEETLRARLYAECCMCVCVCVCVCVCIVTEFS